eukprot:gene24590-30957_t
MPFYGNTHTTTSVTGHQSTCFRHEARQIIAESVNAKVTGKAAEDVVIFTGNGTTAAAKKLIEAIGLHLPFPVNSDESLRPIVFTSSYEHHSNLLPWRESVADVVTIAYSPVTAASNVTGILTAVDSVSILLHLHGALALFDFATAAPYVHIDMNPTALTASIGDNSILAQHAHLAYKDAIFFSGHKFLGGPGCPGVLVAKRRLMPQASDAPTTVGGGTVFYVTEEHHRYLSNREEREEGGTPQILGDVKLGLAMHLKQSVGPQWIQAEELRISQYVQNRLHGESDSIVLLGRECESGLGVSHKHLPVFSFLIRCADRFLHFHFVCVLLNDLFGIQARGGCMCAGPFSQILLGLDDKHNAAVELALLEKHEVLRPGYTRLSLPYWTSPEEVDYVVDAILFVAEHGWKFLSMYRYNHKTGEWAHTTRLTRFPERKWLSNFDINATTASPVEVVENSQAPLLSALKDTWKVNNATELFSNVKQSVNDELSKLDKALEKMNSKKTNLQYTHSAPAVSDDLASFEYLRWFVLSEETSKPHFNPTVVETLKGILNPTTTLTTSSEITGGDDKTTSTASTSTVHSAYSAMRNAKMRAHTGNEAKLPRYMQLIGSTTGGAVDSTTNIVDLLYKAAVHPVLSATTTSNTVPVVVQTQPKVAAVIAPPTIVKSDDVLEQQLFDCSLGECTVKTTAITPSAVFLSPSVVPTPPITFHNGKILSGPGTTYLGIPVPPELASSAPGVKKAAPIVVPKKIMKCVGNAIKDWNMIEEGDRILLGLSGGKDSLAMLHVLLALQKRAPIKFEIACATVDPQTSSFDPSPMIPYVQSLGVTYHYLSEPIVELAKSKLQGDSLCAFCSRFKRGLLYSCCRNNGYNKLVLAQHLDDLVESFLMSALHNGQIRTMKANYKIEAGDVNVIRPFVYVRETATRDFSQSVGLPIINENCPACFEQPKERARVKKLLLQEEAMIPALFFNFKRALMPLLHDETYDAMDRVVKMVEANSYNSKDRVLSATSSSKIAMGGSKRLPKKSKLREEQEAGEAEGQDNEEEEDEESTPVIDSEEVARPTVVYEDSDAIVEGILNSAQTCEPGGFCAPCYELA